jgi:hypothetical protein
VEYVIAVFKSRTQVMKFYEKLQDYNIRAAVVNTPREASLGCGLSVKVNTWDYGNLMKVLRTDNYYSFGGVFKVNENGTQKSVRPY